MTRGPCNNGGDLWGTSELRDFDILFQLPIPKGTTVIGYANDTLVVALGDSVDEMQKHANLVLETFADTILGWDSA